MWVYQQISGRLSKDDILVGHGYSGFGPAKNDPATESLPNVGCIPQGFWTISGPPFDSPEHGPYCLRLTPEKGTVAFGREGFLIHGDSKTHPGQASRGCIVADKVTRTRIYQSGDTRLQVISGEFVAPDVTGDISV